MTLNDRGAPLTLEDLLKNHLFYARRARLLKKSQNNLIENRPVASKQPILGPSEITLTKTAAEAATWGKSAIEARQRKLAVKCQTSGLPGGDV
jgi:uncharacterized protein DUF1524